MDYTKLGNTGMDVSRICLGCMGFGDAERWVHKWVLDGENSRPIIQKALELGINFFDTANVYSIGRSEEILGRALRDFANRDEVVIATKLHGRMREGPNGEGLSRKAILSEIDQSLKRLGTEYVDLYQIHRWDYQTPIEETMGALHDVVKAGKARYIGASAMFAWQFQKALHVAEKHGWTQFVSMQDHLNLDLPRRGAGNAAAVPRGEYRGDPVQSAGLGTIDARLVVGKHASIRDRSDREDQVRRDELVDAHRHTTRRGYMPPHGQADPSYIRRCIRCVAHRDFEVGWGYVNQVDIVGDDRSSRRQLLTAE